MHLPFIYDAYHRHFLQPFAHQYSNIAGLILGPILPLPHPTQTVAKNQDQSGVAHGAATLIENHTVPVDRSATLLRRPFQQIFLKSPRIEHRLLAFLTYIPPLLIGALFLAGLYLCLSKKIAVDRWLLLFSALLGGCLTAFPQFFFFRPDLAHLIEFMSGGLVALTCAGWLLWSSQGRGRLSTAFFMTIALVAICYLFTHSPESVRWYDRDSDESSTQTFVALTESTYSSPKLNSKK